MNSAVIERIRTTAMNTDELIAKLDALTSRIDAARGSGNEELARYYENQFTEASVKFMDAVETIIDGWYEMRGAKRPPAESEELTDEALEQIHAAVIGILHGEPADALFPEADAALTQFAAPAAPSGIAAGIQDPGQAGQLEGSSTSAGGVSKGPRHRVDVTG